ncbi:MAG: LamG-like jellyroll fold domain-containing protein [Candidatus Ratteibacteria bacterium]
MFKKAGIFLSFLTFLCFGESKLVFHLSFDNEQVNDVSGNIKGEVKGGRFVEGKIGKGIYFDGKEREAECIIFKDLAKDRFFQDFEGGPFTISVWIKPDSTKEYNKQQEILNTASDIGPGWRLTYTWRMIIFRTGTGKRDEQGKGEYWEVTTNPSIDKVKPDEWNHIVVVRNEEGVLSLYLNGKKVAESEKKFDIIPSNRFLTVGAYIGGYAYGFKGVIDEVKIYKGALSPEEILKEYEVEGKKIKLDGKLDEDIWKKGKVFTNFKLINTDNFAPVQTKVIFSYDIDNLYFAFICDEPDIAKLKNEIKENSLRVYRDDSIEIMIDADNNKGDYYHFLFNPSGFYGVEFRTQSGFVGSEVKGFKLFTGTDIAKDRWIVEIVIPYSSLTLERIKNDISLNFARNRRVDLSSIQESSIAEKGQFHNPFVFIPLKLENIDLSLYAVEMKDIEFVETEKKDEKINVKLKGKIKNLTDKEKDLEIEIYEGQLGILGKTNLQILPEKGGEFFLNIIVPEPKEYNFTIDIKERGKKIYSGNFPVKVSYIPISLELLKPVYRNSIYPTQKIDEIVLNVKVGLKDDEMKGIDEEILIVDKEGKEIVKKSIKPEKETDITLKILQLKEGEYKIVGRLKKEKNVVYETGIPLYILPKPKGNEVYIDENLNLVLNGKPIMPVIWWGGSPYQEIAKTGADGIIVGVGDLDSLKELGLYGEVMLLWGSEQKKYFEGQDTLSEEAVKVITEKINSVKDHPALLFYYLTDEPEVRSLSANLLKEVYELIKRLDPYHPVQITNDTVKGIETYIECADMFLPDPYVCPLVDGSLTRPMTYIIPFMEEIKKAGKKRKFVGITPQVFDYGKVYASRPPYSTRNNRAPTFVEERCMNYLAIIYGAKGFNYYVYGKREEGHWGAVNIPDLRVGMPYLIKEKKALSDVILLGKDVKEKVNIEDKKIHYTVRQYKGKTYIIAVNVEPVEVNAEIKLLENIKELKVISEKRKINVNDGKFLDIFKPYDVHIYTDDLKFQDVIDLKMVEGEIKKEGGWFTYQYKK